MFPVHTNRIVFTALKQPQGDTLKRPVQPRSRGTIAPVRGFNLWSVSVGASVRADVSKDKLALTLALTSLESLLSREASQDSFMESVAFVRQMAEPIA